MVIWKNLSEIENNCVKCIRIENFALHFLIAIKFMHLCIQIKSQIVSIMNAKMFGEIYYQGKDERKF